MNGIDPAYQSLPGGGLTKKLEKEMDKKIAEALDGVSAKSAYQSYVDTTTDSPVKTEAEWVASLKGEDGVSLGEVAIADNLDTNDARKVLSARQGYELGQKVNNADAEPTAGSDNLVKSGGIADVNGSYTTSEGWIRVVTDANNKILYGIRNDGEFVFGVGVPRSIKDYVLSQKTEVDANVLVEKTRAITAESALGTAIDSEVTRATSVESNKVDKEEGKSLVDTEYASSQSTIDSSEYLQITTDSDDKLLEGIKSDGTKVIGADLKVGGNTTIGGDIKILGNMEISKAKVKETAEILGDFLVNGNFKVQGNARLKATGQRLMGAIYWCGAAGEASHKSSSGTYTHSQLAFEWLENNGYITDINEFNQWLSSEGLERGYDTNHPESRWFYYVIYKTGVVPPAHCSFCMMMHDLGTIYANHQGFLPSIYRKPYLGWRSDSQEYIDEEINLAHRYMLDYFMFIVVANDSIFNSDSTINEEAFWNIYVNTGLKYFLSSTVKWKMKFCISLSLNVSLNIENRDLKLNNLYNFLFSMFNDDSYLWMNGGPVFAFLDYKMPNDEITIRPNFRRKGVKIVGEYNRSDNDLHDGVYFYNGWLGKAFNEAVGHPTEILSYDLISDSNASFDYSKQKEIVFVPISSGWDPLVRRDYLQQSYSHDAADYYRFYPPTRQQFFENIVNSIEFTDKNEKDMAILIYAWNEHSEGGWLVPTYGETTTEQNDYPIIEDGVHKTDDHGNLLYVNFDRLEAVKDAKKYFNNKKF